MSCDSQCSVALPRGTVGWSAVCDCGISLSNSLAYFLTFSSRKYFLGSAFVSFTSSLVAIIKNLETVDSFRRHCT